MPDTANTLAIHELLGLYGHIIDAREWHRVEELFTGDCTYDMREFGLGMVHGARAVAALWAAPDAMHPLAHHATNIIVSEDREGSVRVLSKGLGVGPNGRVGSVTYRDLVIRTPRGWRFAARTGELRKQSP